LNRNEWKTISKVSGDSSEAFIYQFAIKIIGNIESKKSIESATMD
jgi:hypothetical protein